MINVDCTETKTWNNLLEGRQQIIFREKKRIQSFFDENDTSEGYFDRNIHGYFQCVNNSTIIAVLFPSPSSRLFFDQQKSLIKTNLDVLESVSLVRNLSSSDKDRQLFKMSHTDIYALQIKP